MKGLLFVKWARDSTAFLYETVPELARNTLRPFVAQFPEALIVERHQNSGYTLDTEEQLKALLASQKLRVPYGPFSYLS